MGPSRESFYQSTLRRSGVGALCALLLALAAGCAGGATGPYEDPEGDGNVGQVKGSDFEESQDDADTEAPADMAEPDAPEPEPDVQEPEPDTPEPEPDVPQGCQQEWWPDSDQDGAGNSNLAPVTACQAPQGYVDNDDDCDDTDGAVRPGADEVAGDGVDQNCDGMELCFVDADRDGWLPQDPGTQTSMGVLCDAPGLSLAQSGQGVDCDDNNAARSPGAAEVCDGLDQNCDGLADDDAGCPCDVHWREENTDEYDSYLLCDQDLSWNDAAAFCRGVGYELVTVNHQGENSWLAQTALDLGFDDLWIGLHDQDQEGTFVWASGLEAAFTFWNNNQPNNDGGQDCTEIHADSNHPIATWNDAGCGTRQPFWCEAP